MDNDNTPTDTSQHEISERAMLDAFTREIVGVISASAPANGLPVELAATGVMAALYLHLCRLYGVEFMNENLAQLVARAKAEGVFEQDFLAALNTTGMTVQ